MSPTSTGNRGLEIQEPLLFEIGHVETTGVDIADAGNFVTALGGIERTRAIELPGLSEPETMRHFTRLSRKNFAIDMGIFPLGSCTMKHNPRLNEKIARIPGLSDVHPLQPISTIQGSLGVMDELSHWITGLTGMPAVALSPKAGAHGELCGIMAIRAALEDKGNAREYILVPESAHGTNPATAALCGYTDGPLQRSANQPACPEAACREAGRCRRRTNRPAFCEARGPQRFCRRSGSSRTPPCGLSKK